MIIAGLQGLPIPHLPEVVEFAENFLLLDVAAHMSSQWCITHTAWEAAHVPAQVIHLTWEGDFN